MQITTTDGSTFTIVGEVEDKAGLDEYFVSVAEMTRVDADHTFTRCQTLEDFLDWLGF